MGRVTPWPIYFENLNDYQLNIDFFQSFFWVFKGEFFLFCTEWFSGHGVKKKFRGQDQSCENSQLFFSSNENLPNSYHQILVLLVSMNGLTAVNMHKIDFDEINFETKVQSFVYMSMNIS